MLEKWRRSTANHVLRAKENSLLYRINRHITKLFKYFWALEINILVCIYKICGIFLVKKIVLFEIQEERKKSERRGNPHKINTPILGWYFKIKCTVFVIVAFFNYNIRWSKRWCKGIDIFFASPNF